jgi:hypothetical protein
MEADLPAGRKSSINNTMYCQQGTTREQQQQRQQQQRQQQQRDISKAAITHHGSKPSILY